MYKHKYMYMYKYGACCAGHERVAYPNRVPAERAAEAERPAETFATNQMHPSQRLARLLLTSLGEADEAGRSASPA